MKNKKKEEAEMQRIKQNFVDFKKNAKDLSELVYSEEFFVEEVIGESDIAVSHGPISQLVIGGKMPRYETGFTSKLVLKVYSENPNVPVNTLIFQGNSIVKAGDRILAKILKYDEKFTYEMKMHVYDDGRRSHYFERDFKPEESAMELAILDGPHPGKPIRIDRAVNYREFKKK